MKWTTHQISAVGAAWAAGAGLPLLAGVFVGAILPDRLDQALASLYRDKQRGWGKVHRGPTHWFGWWLLLGLAGLYAAPPVPPPVMAVLAGIGMGGLSHVILDLLTPKGVPLWPFSRKGRLSLGLVKTGGFSEYLFLALVCLGLFLWKLPDLPPILQNLTR